MVPYNKRGLSLFSIVFDILSFLGRPQIGYNEIDVLFGWCI